MNCESHEMNLGGESIETKETASVKVLSCKLLVPEGQPGGPCVWSGGGVQGMYKRR